MEYNRVPRLTRQQTQHHHCMYAALISPEDLYRACLLLESLDLPIRMRKFDSGVLVLQANAFDDKVLSQRILELVRSNGPQTILSISEHMNVSITLAGELVQVCALSVLSACVHRLTIITTRAPKQLG
jgi:hypothetical protein